MTDALSAVVLTLAVFKTFDWGRLPWDASYFSVNLNRIEKSENALVIMLGNSPISYVIPEFPSSFRFVRPESNLITYKDQYNFSTGIKDLLKQHTGPMYILYNSEEKNIFVNQNLTSLGLSTVTKECFPLKTNTPDRLVMCSLPDRQ